MLMIAKEATRATDARVSFDPWLLTEVFEEEVVVPPYLRIFGLFEANSPLITFFCLLVASTESGEQ
jgi:hypothetical protein